MAKYRIDWELVETEHSFIEADSPEEAERLAEEAEMDFGELLDVDSDGWRIWDITKME